MPSRLVFKTRHVFFSADIYFLWTVSTQNKKKEEQNTQSGLFWKLKINSSESKISWPVFQKVYNVSEKISKPEKPLLAWILEEIFERFLAFPYYEPQYTMNHYSGWW